MAEQPTAKLVAMIIIVISVVFILFALTAFSRFGALATITCRNVLCALFGLAAVAKGKIAAPPVEEFVLVAFGQVVLPPYCP